MKKICIIVPYDYPVPAVRGGAVETLVEFLINENEKQGIFEFTVLATSSMETAELCKKYKKTVFVLYGKNIILDKILYTVFRIAKKIFHIYLPCSVRFIKAMRFLKSHPEYDYILFESGESYMIPLIKKCIPNAKILNHLHWHGDGNPYIDQSTDYLLPVSKFIAAQWRKATLCGKEKIVIWPNGCDINSMKKAETYGAEDRSALKHALSIAPDAFVILYTGRITEEKGVYELLQAVNKLDEKIHVILVGSAHFGNSGFTSYEKKIHNFIKDSKYPISAVGYVHNTELYKYYSIADLSVMPTKAPEPAGMVNIEAMAAGSALITTDVGAVREYVGMNWESCITVDDFFVDTLAKEIKKYIDDPVLRKRQSKNGMERAEKFTPERFYQTFCNIIERIDEKEQLS